MLYSGVSWDAGGYEVVVVDDDGRTVTPPTRFGTGQIDDLICHLRRLGDGRRDDQPPVTVVESSIGVLDGRMMAAGLPVYRADPWVVPGRPEFGSVPAATLAQAAQRNLCALARLERSRGTQTGRESELEAAIASSAAATRELTRAGRCLSHGGRESNAVALTFDDGPQPPYTDRVLDVLERYGVPATFFCVGLHTTAHAELLCRMREQGHSIGNHTWSHPFLQELTRGQLTAQVERTREAIAEATGGGLPTLFRPPYGSRTPQVMNWLASGESTVVLWDVEPFDWAMPGSDVIARLVLEDVRPGSIILLHDGGGDRSQTVAALPAIIEGVLDRGLSFVPVEALVASPSPSPA